MGIRGDASVGAGWNQQAGNMPCLSSFTRNPRAGAGRCRSSVKPIALGNGTKRIPYAITTVRDGQNFSKATTAARAPCIWREWFTESGRAGIVV